MQEKPILPVNVHPTNRVEAFSDGVFAIAITLLVLELKVPHIEFGESAPELLNAIIEIVPKLAAHILTFITIAIIWVNHHNFFHSIKYVNRRLLWNNNLLLFFICLIPFPTALLGEYPENWVAVSIYSSTLLGMALSFIWMRYQAEPIFKDHINEKSRKRDLKRSMIAPISYLIALIAAPFSILVSYAIFITIMIIYFLPYNYEPK